MEPPSSLRLSSWVLTASSVWAFTLSDFFPFRDSPQINMLLFVAGACALTWASPLAQLAGTKSKPGFRLVTLFRGGSATVLFQAFAWACYGLGVFGCVVVLLNPQIRLRGLHTGLGLLGVSSQVMLELSIRVFDVSQASTPLASWSFSKILFTAVSVIFALVGFVITIAAEWFRFPHLHIVWNLAFGTYLASFSLSQFAIGFEANEDEARTLSRVFSFLMLGCLVWFYCHLHAAEIYTTVRGSTFALGLIGFLTCMLTVFSQWMQIRQPAQVAAAEGEGDEPVVMVSYRHQVALQQQAKTSSVYHLSSFMATLALLLRYGTRVENKGSAVFTVALCLVGAVLAHVGTWLTYRTVSMTLTQPLQGGLRFAVCQGLGWMGFAICLCSILIAVLNMDTMNMDQVASDYLFSLAMCSHMCLLLAKPLFQPKRQLSNTATLLGGDLRLIALLIGSFFLQGFMDLVSAAMSLFAAYLYVDFAHQQAWIWIIAVSCVQLVSYALQAELAHDDDGTQQKDILLVVVDFLCTAVRAVLVSWFSKIEHVPTVEEQQDMEEIKRLAALSTRTTVQDQLLRKRPNWLLDNQSTCVQLVCIHLILLCFASPSLLYPVGVVTAPVLAIYMELHHLQPLQRRQRLHSPHVVGWFILGFSLVGEWIAARSQMHLGQTGRLLGCASYLGLITLFSIDPMSSEPEQQEQQLPKRSHKRQTVSWILNISALVTFLGIDFFLLKRQQDQLESNGDVATASSSVMLMPVVVSAWLAVALSVPLAYFTSGQNATALGVTKVLGVALWTFSLFLILMLLGGGASGVSLVSNTLAYSQTGIASLIAQTLLSKGDLVFISQFIAMLSSLVFLYLFLPSLRWFLDYPMWWFAYYFKSWRHSISPDGLHPYKDVVVVRNIRFYGNGIMDVMAPDAKEESAPLPPPSEAPIIFMHGGAHLFCLREIFIHSMTPFSRAGLCLYAVEYPLSPEVKFPQALITVMFAMDHVARNHCQTGCCLRGEPAKRCCDTCVHATDDTLCKCCPHFRGTDKVQLLGDSAGGNLAALVCAVVYNRPLFDLVFSQCKEYPQLQALRIPMVQRLGLIYALIGKEVRDKEDEMYSHWNRAVGRITTIGLDYLLTLYTTVERNQPIPAVLLNDFLQHEPCLITAFAPETLMIVGTRDPLLYPNRLACKLLKQRFPEAKIELIEIPGSFHGFHGLPPQWNVRWKIDALPATRALIGLFTGGQSTTASADFDIISRDFSPFIVFPLIFLGLATGFRLVFNIFV